MKTKPHTHTHTTVSNMNPWQPRATPTLKSHPCTVIVVQKYRVRRRKIRNKSMHTPSCRPSGVLVHCNAAPLEALPSLNPPLSAPPPQAPAPPPRQAPPPSSPLDLIKEDLLHSGTHVAAASGRILLWDAHWQPGRGALGAGVGICGLLR